MSSGYQGARFISLIRGVVGIFFFGVQTYFISKSIGYLIRISFFQIDNELLNNDIFFNYFMTMNLIDWVSFVFTIFVSRSKIKITCRFFLLFHERPTSCLVGTGRRCGQSA